MSIATAIFFLCWTGSARAAVTGGAAITIPTSPPPPSPVGAPTADAPSSGNVSLTSAITTPRKSFYYGVRNPVLRFTINSDQPQNDLQIDVVNTTGEVAATFYRNDVAPGVETRIRWDGTLADGKPARNGRYSFRIQPQGGAPLTLRRVKRATTSETPGVNLNFAIYRFAFPVLGTHDFGSSGAVFGAGRSGHTHQGQDVMARCGLPLVAARGGRVIYSGYHGSAGNYIVIDGWRTGLDMAYMHLAAPSPLKVGATVRTGQPIGLLGDTGNAFGCHLHFEIWSAPGWYKGGSPVNPLPYLLNWDRYS